MSKKEGKLFRLKEWLTVPEAAKHLSIIFGEDVSEADIFRLALDGHLKLSVYFVNHAKARCGKIVSYEEVQWYPSDYFSKIEGFNNATPTMKSLQIDDNRYLNLEQEVTTIRGVWDLSMVGSERLDVQHEYQNLIGGPEVTLIGLDGVFVEHEDGVMCQLQDSLDQNEYQRGSIANLERIKEHIASNNVEEKKAEELILQHKKDRETYLNKKYKNKREDDYYPAGGLPHDGVLVVRTQALIDLQERLSYEESEKNNKSLDEREEIIREHCSEAGKKGGPKPKMNQPILEAVKLFMRENSKIINQANEAIAKKFCNKFKEVSPMSVTIDQVKYEVFDGGGIIVSRHGERYDGVKSVNQERTIAYTTFRTRYIANAKKHLSAPESQ